MGKWISCRGNVIAGDVVRWIEPIWKEKGKGKQKLVKIGVRHMTAAVTRLESRDWVHLSVLKCVIKDIQQAKPLEPLRNGEAVKRKRSTLERGDAERLPWTGSEGEPVRALAISKFLGSR
jgi:hypothetical protein